MYKLIMVEAYSSFRFDDTNPSNEKQEFQDAIVEDLALMGRSSFGFEIGSTNSYPQAFSLIKSAIPVTTLLNFTNIVFRLSNLERLTPMTLTRRP
jgi:hypothetical protein